MAAQAGTLSITNISMVGGYPQLSIQSNIGITNQIQCKTNLSQTNWVVLTNLMVAQSPYSFVDVSTASASSRFYRVIAAAAGTFYPTNVGSPVAWWRPFDQATNASGQVTTWTNAYNSSLNLVQTYPSAQPYISNAWLNAIYPAVKFDGLANCIYNASYSVSQPHEIWMYLSRNGYSSGYPAVFGGNTGNETLWSSSANYDRLTGGGTGGSFNNGGMQTNGQWYVLTCIFDGAKSRVLTNNVVAYTGDTDAVAENGICFGASYGGANCAPLTLAEIASYSATNSVVNQSNIYWYFTNKFQNPASIPLTISGIASSGITTNSATITWTSDLSTTNDYVYFSMDTSYSMVFNSTAGGTSHSIVLSNLAQATTYNFKVVSACSGTTVTSTPAYFTTAAIWAFSTDFSSGLPFNVASNWGISGGFATNAPYAWELMADPTFQNPSGWTVYTMNAAVITGEAIFTNLSTGPNANVVQATPYAPSPEQSFWHIWSCNVSALSSGYFVPILLESGGNYYQPVMSFAKTYGAAYLDNSRNNGNIYLPGVSGNNYPPAINGTVTSFSLKRLNVAQTVAITNVQQSDVAVSCRISLLPTNGAAGITLRHKFLYRCLAIGDSKTTLDGGDQNWPYFTVDPVFSGNTYSAIAGQNTAQISQTLSNNFANYGLGNDLFDVAFIDAGVNDYDFQPGGTVAALSVQFSNIVFNLQGHYPAIKCYLANVWRNDGVTNAQSQSVPFGGVSSNNNANAAIDLIVGNNSTFCYKSFDERILLSGSDMGTNETFEGIHPRLAMAQTEGQLLSTLTNLPANPRGAQDGIFVYYNSGKSTVDIMASCFGTNMMLQQTSVGYVSNALLTASVNATNIKVFYNGSQVGTYQPLTWPNLNTNTEVGLFATHTNTQFSFFSVGNSTPSLAAP